MQKENKNSNLIEAKQLYNLPITYNGITLNNQDIDLMLIPHKNYKKH